MKKAPSEQRLMYLLRWDFFLLFMRMYGIIKIPLVAGTTGGIYKGTKNII